MSKECIAQSSQSEGMWAVNRAVCPVYIHESNGIKRR